MGPKLVVLWSQEKLQVYEKNYFDVDMIFKMVCGNFLKSNGSQDI